MATNRFWSWSNRVCQNPRFRPPAEVLKTFRLATSNMGSDPVPKSTDFGFLRNAPEAFQFITKIALGQNAEARVLDRSGYCWNIAISAHQPGKSGRPAEAVHDEMLFPPCLIEMRVLVSAFNSGEPRMSEHSHLPVGPSLSFGN